MWHATIITLFPEMFPGPLAHSIAGRCLEKGMWGLDVVDMRNFATDKHLTVDDSPYGGGTGLVIMPHIAHQALQHVQTQRLSVAPEHTPKYIYMSPRGKPLTHTLARTLSENPGGVVILCGRYEGIDDRVIEKWREEEDLIEVSIGDYVLSGGEMGALVVLDACIRLLPNVLIKAEATQSESFEDGLLEFSQYTKPRIWEDRAVPDVLLSGDHGKIAKWRLENAQAETQRRRPDVWQKYIARPF